MFGIWIKIYCVPSRVISDKLLWRGISIVEQSNTGCYYTNHVRTAYISFSITLLLSVVGEIIVSQSGGHPCTLRVQTPWWPAASLAPSYFLWNIRPQIHVYIFIFSSHIHSTTQLITNLVLYCYPVSNFGFFSKIYLFFNHET